MAKNKIVYGSEVLIDLTADTVTADKLASGITVHDKSGEVITGTNTYDSDTTDATAAVAEVLTGKTFYARGSKMTGTMPNNGAVTGTIAAKDDQYSVAQGYHDGSGKVGIVALNNGKAEEVMLTVKIANGTVLKDQISGKSFTVTDGTLTLPMGENQAMMLVG